MASGPVPAMGSLPLGRPIADWARAAGRGLPSELDTVLAAIAQWLDPAELFALVFRPHPLHGGAVLLLAMPRFETQPLRLPYRRRRFWVERLLRRNRMAANAEWSGLGASRFSFLPAGHARRIAGGECSPVRRRSRILVP